MMNNIELYAEFLENNLDTEAEQSFAENFAVDSEFRDEFRKFIKLSNALKVSSAFFVPPDSSKDAVFSALGLSQTDGNMPEAGSKLSHFFKGRLFSSSVASILTVFIMLWLMHSGFINEQKSSVVSNYGNATKHNEYSPSGLTKAGREEKNISKSSFHKAKPNTLASAAKIELTTGIGKDNIDRKIEFATNIQDEHLTFMKNKAYGTENSILTENKYTPIYDTIYFIRSYDSKFKFEFKNTPSWFVASPKIQPYTLNKFNNLSIALHYPIYKALSIGAEFRQETFYVEYEGISQTGELTKFYQQPNLSSFGISLRYGFFDFGKELKPYGQIQMGVNTTGIVTRELAGIEYYPFDYVFFLIAGEYNQFYFSHDKKWFNAQKFSINYGIGIKF